MHPFEEELKQFPVKKKKSLNLSHKQIQTNPEPQVKILWSLTSSGVRPLDVAEKRKSRST